MKDNERKNEKKKIKNKSKNERRQAQQKLLSSVVHVKSNTFVIDDGNSDGCDFGGLMPRICE